MNGQQLAAVKQLIEDLISAMKYHVEQTRPIHSTTVALQAAREALKSMSAPLACDCKQGQVCGVCDPITPPAPQSVPVKCWCHKCNEHNTVNGLPFSMTQMILCPECGNKRCPKASDHQLDCTGSNEAGQHGSVYTAAQPTPVQEPVAWMRTLFSPELGEFFDYKDGAFANETDSVGWTPLYTTPQPVPVKTYHDGKPWPVAPKPWAGLTADEMLEALTSVDPATQRLPVGFSRFARAIEAKLKEKNT
jgi:hypothetical protein